VLRRRCRLRLRLRRHRGPGSHRPRTCARRSASVTPPDRKVDTVWDALGANVDEIREFAIGGLTRWLEIIGVPLSSL
jgi:hypothetical protein